MLYSKAQTHLAILKLNSEYKPNKMYIISKGWPRRGGTPAPSSWTSGPSPAGAFLGHPGCPRVHFLSPSNKHKEFLQTPQAQPGWALPALKSLHGIATPQIPIWAVRTPAEQCTPILFAPLPGPLQIPNPHLFGFCLCFLVSLYWGGVCCNHSSSCCGRRRLLLLMLFVFLVLFILFMLLILLFLLLLATTFLIWILEETIQQMLQFTFKASDFSGKEWKCPW